MSELHNKVILITGSSHGIGRAIALRCAKERARIIVTYCTDHVAGEKTAQQCRELGSPQVEVVQLNVQDSCSIRSAVEQVIAMCGGIDVLVNNAGVIRWKRLEKQQEEDIAHQIGVNLQGLIMMTQSVLLHAPELIVNISSGSGRQGYPLLTTYCATKFGVRGFTKALAAESSVQVISVNPPLTQTRMSDYQGISVAHVADIVCDTIQRADAIDSGSDIDISREVE